MGDALNPLVLNANIFNRLQTTVIGCFLFIGKISTVQLLDFLPIKEYNNKNSWSSYEIFISCRDFKKMGNE